MRSFVDRHLGVQAAVANVITGNVIQSLRRYFLGVTIVATFNAFVVGIGACSSTSRSPGRSPSSSS